MHNALFIALENINFVRNQDLLIGLKARLKEVEERLTPMTDVVKVVRCNRKILTSGYLPI